MFLTGSQIDTLKALLDLSIQNGDPVTLDLLAEAIGPAGLSHEPDGDLQSVIEEWLWANRPNDAFALQRRASLFGEMTPRALPEGLMRELYEEVRSDGPLPDRVLASRSTPLPPLSSVIYNPENVAKILKSLVVFRIEGEENACYFFSSNRNQVVQTLRIYLMRAGRTSSEAALEADDLVQVAIALLGERVVPLRSEAEIIPHDFVRADQIDPSSLIDPFTGETLTIQRVLSRITRRYPPEVQQNFMRTIVMRNGRKIYYVDWPYLQENYPLDLFQLPDLEGLKRGIKKRDALIPFFDKLRHLRNLSPLDWSQKQKFVLVGFGGNQEEEGVAGLTILTEEEFFKTKPDLDRHYFRLVFDWFKEELFISKLDGLSSLELGQHFIGKPNRSPLEQALLARRWGTLHHEEGESKVSWDDLIEMMKGRGDDPIDELWNLICLADPRLDSTPSELVFVAAKTGTSAPYLAHGINLASVTEGFINKDSYARLFFERRPESQQLSLCAIRGAYSLEPALAFVRGRLKRETLHPAEIGLLMTLWETKPNSGGHTLTLNELGRFLGEDQNRLLELVRFKKALGYPWQGRGRQFVLTGFVKNGTDLSLQANLLELLPELPPHQEGHFYLVFNKVKGKIFLTEAGGSYALPLAFTILEGTGWANRPITHPLEKAVLASSWGRAPSARRDPTLRLTWRELKESISNPITNPIAGLWNLKRLTYPDLPENPERIFLVGARKGKKENSPIISIQLLSGAEERKTGIKGGLFKIPFNRGSDGIYRPADLGVRSHSASRALYASVPRGSVSSSVSLPHTVRGSSGSSDNDGGPKNFSGLSVFSGVDDRQLQADRIMMEAQTQVFEDEGGAAIDLSEESSDNVNDTDDNTADHSLKTMGSRVAPWARSSVLARQARFRVVKGGLII